MGGGEWGEGEPATGPPLPFPLLLKHDISEAAGAPEEVGKKWKPVGSPGRGARQETQGIREGDRGAQIKGNKEGPLESAHFPLRPDIWDTVGSWRRGSQGRLDQRTSSRLPTHPNPC